MPDAHFSPSPFSNKRYLAAGAIALLAVAAVALYLWLGSDEDRPPIIVHNGSLVFDAGDPQDATKRWKEWKQDAGAPRWRPVHPKGHSVASYSVTVAGAANPDACGTAAMSTTEVFIDYTLDAGGAGPRAHVYRDPVTGSNNKTKWEPAVDGPATMTVVAATPTSPGEIVYPNPGYISSAIVGNTTCTFKKPENESERRFVRITIQPER